HALLLRRFDGYKPHCGPCNSFADRLRISRIVLPALHIGPHILGWQQPHLVPASDEFARPIMRGAAGFNPDETWLQLLEERQDTPACETPANNNLSNGINSVNLKDTLCDIQSDGCN